jgi:hypothetical protein
MAIPAAGTTRDSSPAARFEPGMGAEPYDFARLLLQGLRDRKCRIDMAAGATCQYENWLQAH